MTPGRDDDALTWDGDDDPTLDVGDAPESDIVKVEAAVQDAAADEAVVEPAALPDGFEAVGLGSDAVGRIGADGTVTMPGDRAPMGNAMLVSLGVIAGSFLLYTIGWIIGGLRLAGTAQFLVSPGGYQFALWLAIAAPALWFVATLVLTRRSKTWVRIAWLVAGLVLLVPWPLLTTGPAL